MTEDDDSVNVDSRREDERDDELVSISRGMLKQLLREAFGPRVGLHPAEIDVPFLEPGSTIEGAMYEGDGKLSLQLVGGELVQCEFWPEEIQ